MSRLVTLYSSSVTESFPDSLAYVEEDGKSEREEEGTFHKNYDLSLYSFLGCLKLWSRDCRKSRTWLQSMVNLIPKV